MSDPDDEFIERLKELKNKKDALEERLTYLESREDNLKFSLSSAIIETQLVNNVENRDFPGGITKGYKNDSENRNLNSLQDSLATVLNWVKITDRIYVDKTIRKLTEESLNKAIAWASLTDPDEEDRILQELLEKTLESALNWVKRIRATVKEQEFKQQLVKLLMFAIDWASGSGGDDDYLVQTLTEYLNVASNWTKVAEEKGREEITGINEAADNLEDSEDRDQANVDELEENEQKKIARQELQQSLKEIFDWVKTIDAKQEERIMQHALLDSLNMNMHWIRTGAAVHENEIIKRHLLETLLISLNWVIIVDDDEGEDMKQKLVDSLIFAIDWATSDETRGDDLVMRTLLRRSLKSAIEWKKGIDKNP